MNCPSFMFLIYQAVLVVRAELDDSQQEVMDMFDLVEEVGQNFYDYISINPGTYSGGVL